MRRIVDIPIFELANKGNAVTKKMLEIPVMADRVDPEYIQDAIQVIDRRFSYSMKIKTISNYRNQEVIPVFNKNITLSPFIPAFMIMYNNKAVAVCNLSNVASTAKDGKGLNIDNRVLYTMLQTGTILTEYANNFDTIKLNSKVSQLGSEIFSKLAAKILDAKFAINLSPQKADIIHFLLSKFFLIYQMERANDTATNNLAYQSTSGSATLNFLIDYEKEKFKGNIYDKGILFFISALSTVDGLGKLNGRLFLKQWVQKYGESTMLALEYLPYFYHMVFASLIGGNLNKQYMIEAVASNQIIELDKELAKVIR